MLTLLYHFLEGNPKDPTVKKVVFSQDLVENKDIALFVSEILDNEPSASILLTDNKDVFERYKGKGILLFPKMPELEENCIVKFDSDRMRILSRPSANNQFLFMTYNCNHYCLMCSEPPRTENDSYLVEDNLKLIELLDKNTEVVGITGGEPTLAGKNFIKIIKKIRECLPEAYIRVLTNGKSYKNDAFTKELAEIGGDRYISEIPLYHSDYMRHDYIVQSRNAFFDTVEGIYNCAKHDLFVDIRVVLTKQNYQGLPDLIYFIYKNMPFVTNIALMGLEYTGFAKLNFDDIHVSPLDYKEDLMNAIELCRKYQLPVTIYNLPLCLLDESIREYARQSISDWKDEFSDACESCIEKEHCAGMFATTRPVYESYLKPIVKG